VELVDSEAVIELVLQETRAQHAHVGSGTIKEVDEADAPHVLDAVKEVQQKFRQEQAQRAAVELKTVIKQTRDLRKSDMMRSMRLLRDQRLAHNLVESDAQNVIEISPMKYGDERKILEQTLTIVETLYRWINSTGISFSHSREMDRKCAEGLWKACTFSVTY
jgi:hypothetical protein